MLTITFQRQGQPRCKALCMITLTRIFLLTHDYPSLVREITTPSLPTFITSCLNIAKTWIPLSDVQVPVADGDLLFTGLAALAELIPLHPTLFRPFVSQIESTILPLVAATPSTTHVKRPINSVSSSVSESARRLLVLLHVCAPKNTSTDVWAKSISDVLMAIHRTASRTFRALIEDRDSSTKKIQDNGVQSYGFEDEVADMTPGSLVLPSWSGIYAGIERLDGLLQTLQAFLATTSSAPIALPVSGILKVTERISLALPPKNDGNPRTNVEIDRDEREGLWIGLPRLHVSTLQILSALIARLGCNLASLSDTVLKQVFWILEGGSTDSEVRRSAYGTVSQILTLFGPAVTRSCMPSLSRCIELCCEDLLPHEDVQKTVKCQQTADSRKSSKGGASSMDADSYLMSSKSRGDAPKSSKAVQAAASKLLALSVTNLSSELLASALRVQVDRTAVLTKNKEAMMASTMYLSNRQAGRTHTNSIMPLLSRSHADSLEVEALLRPQMPVLKSSRSETALDDDEDSDMRHNSTDGVQKEPKYDWIAFDRIAEPCEDILKSVNLQIEGKDLPDFRRGTLSYQEPSVSVYPTTAASNKSPAASPRNSNKRNPEDIHDLQRNAPDVSLKGSTSTRADVPSKRPRLDLEEDEAAIRGKESETTPASNPRSRDAFDTAIDAKQDDSEESDSELPRLFLDSDSDVQVDDNHKG